MNTINDTIKNIINFFKYVWKYNRLELFLVLSIIFFIIYYFFKSQEDEYKGISIDIPFSNLKNIKLEKKRRVNKYENECRKIVENKLNKSFNTVRPNFLKNPKTKKNLELDMYNHELKLALEYQGIQHRVYTPYYHKNYNDYLKQVDRDNYKKEKCKEQGITLIEIPDTVKFDELDSYITGQLKENGYL